MLDAGAVLAEVPQDVWRNHAGNRVCGLAHASIIGQIRGVRLGLRHSGAAQALLE
jgi:hypothetical protein